MKRILAVATVCAVIAIVAVSCASNKKCPAYRSQSMPQIGIAR